MKRILVVVALLSLAAAAAAQTTVVVQRFDTGATKARWTAEAFALAKPVPLPRVEYDPARVNRAPAKAAVEEPFTELFPSVAEEPTLSGREAYRYRRQLFDYSREELRRLRGRDETPAPLVLPGKNYGTGGLDYTSSRLIPSSAVESFPYRPVGKLFFSIGDDNFVCSGALITRRLVVTAGHCVHGGPAEGFFEDILFVPAYRDGDAPFGTWAATTVFVTSGWAGDGEVPHPEDYALLEMEDQADGTRIHQVTGKLAFVADQLADNHLHLLGYPVNLDDGEEMHQVTSGDWFDLGNGTVVYGGDMRGGASGGPWIQNFNRKSRGQGGGRNRARAAVVGVSSYTFEEDHVRVLGASKLTRTFKVLRQEACRNQANNC